MDLRASVRQWCAEHVPAGWRDQMRGAPDAEVVAFLRWWHAEVRASGWLVPHWPARWGGGFSVADQVVIAEEMARGDAPRSFLYQVALYNAAPTIIHAGTDEQKQRFLPGMLDGEVWCQGFSEPNAGSDLASLSTRAVRDGDHYVVTGQKIWTSMAHHADWCILLARTDPDAPKHRGISCMAVDMHSPGVEVRPIRQATGAAEFCETFLDEVRVPVENRFGAENDGWRVAQGTLSSERALVIVDLAERLRRNGIEAAVLQLSEAGAVGPATEEMLAEAWAEAQVLRHLLGGMIDGIVAGADVGGTASVIKVFYSELLQRFHRQMTDHLGLAAQVQRPLLQPAGWETGNWMSDYLNSWGWTVGGGTNEIMRNVIGERMLGLPR